MRARHVLGKTPWRVLLPLWAVSVPAALTAAWLFAWPLDRIAPACLLVIVMLTLWGRGRYAVVSVDRATKTVTTQRRFCGVPLTEAALQLDEISDVFGRGRGRVTRILLATRHGDAFVATVPARHAEEEVTALKGLLSGAALSG